MKDKEGPTAQQWCFSVLRWARHSRSALGRFIASSLNSTAGRCGTLPPLAGTELFPLPLPCAPEKYGARGHRLSRRAYRRLARWRGVQALVCGLNFLHAGRPDRAPAEALRRKPTEPQAAAWRHLGLLISSWRRAPQPGGAGAGRRVPAINSLLRAVEERTRADRDACRVDEGLPSRPKQRPSGTAGPQQQPSVPMVPSVVCADDLAWQGPTRNW